MTKIAGFSKRNKSNIEYPDCVSALKPVPHDLENPVPVPPTTAFGMKKTYDSMEILLKVINYSDHNWNICGDLKVISLLLGLQLGYTKHMCFLCLWNSRDDSNHYTIRNWPERTEYKIGM